MSGLLLVFGLGCNELAGIEGAAPDDAPYCADAEDCAALVDELVCRALVGCIENRCAFRDEPLGTLLPPERQSAADCRRLSCDGAGHAKIDLDEDPETDGNPCTADVCRGFATVHEPLPFASCYTGPAGTSGVGLCSSGIQQCELGQPVGDCKTEVVPEAETCLSPADEDCDGQANEDGEGCVCVPGTFAPCFTGPAGALDVGECHAGTMMCAPSGLDYGPCVDEVLPGEERCDPPGHDEDCDGLVDELVECHCGNGILQAALGETCDDGNPIPFDSCTDACAPAACGDGIVSTSESCDDGNVEPDDACPADCKVPLLRIAAQRHGMCALSEAGTIKCWGSNFYGLLGLGDMDSRGVQPGQMGQALPSIDLGPLATARSIAAGSSHACAVLSTGEFKCWGLNVHGALGLGDTEARGDTPGEMGTLLPSLDVGTGKTVAAAAGGSGHTCVLLVDGLVKCWGDNLAGQLGLEIGLGDVEGPVGDGLAAVSLGSGKKATAVYAGGRRSCALLVGGTIKCWGNNDFGALGLGDQHERGLESNTMGDVLPEIDLGVVEKPVALALGYDHTCALLADARVKCWGRNLLGSLGLGDMKDRGSDLQHMGAALPFVDVGLGKKAIALAAGDLHTCALLADGAVKCWGRNSMGQLGLGDTEDRGDQVGEMGDALPAVDLGTGKRAVAITAGDEHTCALLADGSLKCWGANSFGQLGLGDTVNRGDEPGEMGDALPAVPLF
jgi:cysteine-rich repeat protein